MINLLNYFKLIRNIDYAVVKYDVPYMPLNFPLNYPIGKDLDLYVSKNNFELIINITNQFIKDYNYNNLFSIKIVQIKYNIRFRFEINNKLHYQIDITIDNFNYLENKQLIKNTFYILSYENELIVRKEEVKKHPNKKHHIEWINKHI